jgi:hypothetical protein
VIRPAPLLVLLALAIGCAEAAPAGNPDAASASAAATPTASPAMYVADAGADDDAGDGGAPKPRRPPPPRVRTLDVPEETKSAVPKPDDWKDAVRRDLASRDEYSCTLERVREWHRIDCGCTNATVSLVAGTRDGVFVWAAEDKAQLIFPVRRGDRRVLQVTPHAMIVSGMGPYGSPGEQPGGPPIVFSETWLEGEDAPTLVIQ